MPITMNQPIPGENYTSDTKNYPWHRPPEFTDLDEALEMTFKKLLSKNGSLGILTMLEAGVDVATLTDIYVTAGIGAGKWTPDFALLMAGPVAHVIYLIGRGYDLEPDLGIDDGFKGPTINFLKGEMKLNKKKAAAAAASVDTEMVKSSAMSQEDVGSSEDVGGDAGFAGLAQGMGSKDVDPAVASDMPFDEEEEE